MEEVKKPKIKKFLILGLIIFLIVFFTSSCSTLYKNTFIYEELNGLVFLSNEDDAIMFDHDCIRYYIDEEEIIIFDFEVKKNRIVFNYENDEVRFYVLDEGYIYSTFDKCYYEVEYYEP